MKTARSIWTTGRWTVLIFVPGAVLAQGTLEDYRRAAAVEFDAVRPRWRWGLGFIVVQIDGTGTNNRWKAFHDVAWRNLDAG